MDMSYFDRASMMLPDVESHKELEAYGYEVESWVAAHAAIVRTLGRTRLTRSSLSVTCDHDGAQFECTFFGERGTAYTLNVVGDGKLGLSNERYSSVLNIEAAHHAMAALLDELGLSAILL